ncbi:glycosyltransferase [Ferruginibacter sp. HRS2-29]|uniref:glycosyltransferase family 2 protein n=1 Tax=Ferruginibacter sp. HRS2-29 TaxID=2487334 RepID=UPI0020CB7A83|nr:glycosyltransferase [Ferruginibacter sp. HRS2-29]MCP9749626.1 glycosyltransferase [Ferruginibacter sp. HRS2-29]
MAYIVLFVSLAFLLIYIFLILYYRSAWNSISDYVISKEKFSTKVTVIIPARNEEKNIGRCLESITAQDFPAEQLQVIVVDDHSEDETASIVLKFAHKQVELIDLSSFTHQNINSYKKKAIEVAIAKSSGELIITTDADCIVPPLWLQTIVSFFNEENAKFIAMPVTFSRRRSLLGIFQLLDFMVLQGITGASVEQGVHSMCNGANLAYSKEAFFAVEGFKGIDGIASGDDMLLMHKIAVRYPDDIHFLKSPDVVVETAPMDTLRDFFNQRIRWASKADKYDDKRIFAVLLIVYLFNFLLLAIPFGLAWFNPRFTFQLSGITIIFSLAEWWVLMLVVKTWIEMRFLFPVAMFFDRAKLLWWFPLAQPFHILYTVIAGWLGKFGSYEWKQRKVK